MGSFPNGVDEIINFLAMTASGFDNRLQWVEEAMFKADLMNTPERWRTIDPRAFEARCLESGMRADDAESLTRYLVRSKNGGKLAPQKNYRSYRFPQPVSALNTADLPQQGFSKVTH